MDIKQRYLFALVLALAPQLGGCLQSLKAKGEIEATSKEEPSKTVVLEDIDT